MASVFELATLSEMAYDSTRSTFRNWKRIGSYGPGSGHSFYSEYYYNIQKKEVVLAIRGTDAGGDATDMSDIYSDIQIGLANTPSQLKKAKEAYGYIKSEAEKDFRNGYNFYLTGHSLGGGLASLLSAINGGKPTVTFNAPGVQRTFTGSHLINNIAAAGASQLLNKIKSLYYMRSVNTDQMLHIRATDDPVSIATGKHMGKVNNVYVGSCGDDGSGVSHLIAQHSISNMVKALRSMPGQYHKDLGWKSEA